ncbi:uncharacterized protein LOC128675287 [Plodia interpunctella]|uniref:uncharacterized protein LOC128675287 n=1 Tax=Plodia interpunctella TaxID=58824 RepID=UPI002368C922|nr:uncharacterized protein LOC128675287 [Plodia interpunctella]
MLKMADVRALIFCCVALTTLDLSSSFEIPNFNLSDLPHLPGLGSDLELPHLNRSEFGFPHLPFFGSGFNLPSFPSFFGVGRKRRDTDFQFPHLNMSGFGLPNFWSSFPQLPSFPSLLESDRTRRDTEATADNQEENHQDRFFFSRFPTITSCNTTSQGGRSCLNCRQALNCLANNLGLLTTCRGLLQYCDQGRCVYNRPSNCTS